MAVVTVMPKELVEVFFKRDLTDTELVSIKDLLISDDRILSDVDFMTYVYEHGDAFTNSNNQYSYWQKNIAQLKQKFQDKNVISQFRQLENFIDSAIIQYKKFLETTAKMNRDKEETSKKLKDAQVKLKETSKKIDSMLTQYISILGVFATIVFGMFGGFDSLKEIMSNIAKGPITTILISFSSLMLGLFCLVFLLIQSIARLTNKDTLNCEHHESKKNCTCSLIERYPIFIISIIFFTLVLIISCVIRFFDYKSFYNCSGWFYSTLAIVVALIVVSLLYLILKKPKKQ